MNLKSKTLKTAISLSPLVMSWGKELMAEKGFADNFSAYVADLIRHDKDNADLKKKSGFIKADQDGHRDGNGVRKSVKH
jgi:hypothetical protein